MFFEKGRSFDGVWSSQRDARAGGGPSGRTGPDPRHTARGPSGPGRLPADHALILAPCTSVHTWFMRFPIDVIFVGRDGEVLKTRANVPAWRMLAAWGGYATIEMAPGAIARSGISRGDRLELVPASK